MAIFKFPVTITYNGNEYPVEGVFDHLPDTCPRCKRSIHPIVEFAKTYAVWGYGDNTHMAMVYFTCPGCCKGFLGTYGISVNDIQNPTAEDYNTSYFDTQLIEPDNFASPFWDERVSKLSPQFVQQYWEAEEIRKQQYIFPAGMSFRRAFELLFKDYLCSLKDTEEEKEKIRQHKQLAVLIAKSPLDERLKAIAKSCAWLGNDYAHYYNKHPENSIDDLIMFIKAVANWISMLLISDEAEKIQKR